MPSSGLLGAVGSSTNTSSNNLQGAAGTGAAAVRRDEGIISGLSEAGDIYLILFKVRDSSLARALLNFLWPAANALPPTPIAD